MRRRLANQFRCIKCLAEGMTELEQKILNSLVELDEAVQAMADTLPKPSLGPLLSRIEELTRQLPRNTDRDLLHYLHRKSYQKAKLFLQGRDAENAAGACPR